MSLSEQLRALANGFNPETGEVLNKNSIVNTPEVIRALFTLADELSDSKKNKNKKKVKLTADEKIAKNLQEGKPARSHFPWEEREKELLTSFFKANNNIKEAAQKMERSELAVAVQLEKLSLIKPEDVERYR